MITSCWTPPYHSHTTLSTGPKKREYYIERGATTEFIQFLFVAKGSCGEVRAQLTIAQDQGYLSPGDYERLYSSGRLVSGMLSNLIAHLQTSGYKGEKFARPKRLADQKR